MARYRKLPVEIDAIHFDGTPASAAAVMQFIEGGQGTRTIEFYVDEDPNQSHINIPTLEGTMCADADDWVIRGIKGELYPCKPDIFAATYEPVEP